MEIQPENEYLLFRNRIRRFTERLLQDENKVYKDLGIKIPIRWMRVMHILDIAEEPLSITEIARSLNRTHPDIHHITMHLLKEKLIKNIVDRKDHRRRLVSLTAKGEEEVSKLKPVWEATEDATANWIFDLAPEFLIYLQSLEDSLTQKSYHQRIIEKIKENTAQKISINNYKKLESEDRIIQQFFQNWEKEFHPVPSLNSILVNIRSSIINKGGQVFFAFDKDTCVGLVVLQRISFDLLQLLFMYVLPSARRKYIGNKLVKESISFAKDIGCKTIIAHINRMLVPVDGLLRENKFELSREINKNYLPYQNLPHTMVLKISK